MVTGARALSYNDQAIAVHATSGASAVGVMGGDRMSWMNSSETPMRFGVIFIDEVSNSYYNHHLAYDAPVNIEGRNFWNYQTEQYAVVERMIRERELWPMVRILLVHVAASIHAGMPDEYWPLWPPHDPDRPRNPLPRGINWPSTVPFSRGRSVAEFRVMLEQAGCPVVPDIMYFDVSGSMEHDTLDPGFSAWISQHDPAFGVVYSGNESWVAWAREILELVLEYPP
jgi:hypothetical protein